MFKVIIAIHPARNRVDKAIQVERFATQLGAETSALDEDFMIIDFSMTSLLALCDKLSIPLTPDRIVDMIQKSLKEVYCIAIHSDGITWTCESHDPRLRGTLMDNIQLAIDQGLLTESDVEGKLVMPVMDSYSFSLKHTHDYGILTHYR